MLYACAPSPFNPLGVLGLLAPRVCTQLNSIYVRDELANYPLNVTSDNISPGTT